MLEIAKRVPISDLRASELLAVTEYVLRIWDGVGVICATVEANATECDNDFLRGVREGARQCLRGVAKLRASHSESPAPEDKR